MNDGEKDQSRRQHCDVEDIEAKERSFSNAVAAEKKLAQLPADDGCVAADVAADRDGPEGQLIPRQQIASEGEPKREQKQHKRSEERSVGKECRTRLTAS